MSSNDIKIAQWYVRKEHQACSKGIEFTLNFTSFKNLARAKRCGYTGLRLDDKTRTIDRIDNSQGYIKGNVIACHTAFNSVKGLVENPTNPLTKETLLKGVNRWNREV